MTYEDVRVAVREVLEHELRDVRFVEHSERIVPKYYYVELEDRGKLLDQLAEAVAARITRDAM